MSTTAKAQTMQQPDATQRKPKTKQPQPRVLLVDDNESVRLTLEAVLQLNNFRVTTASNVPEALRLIARKTFDVLLTDLHMPGAGDGLTVVSAMRHINPQAVTLLFTGFPALDAAMKSILLQADEVLVKPMAIPDLISTIQARLRTPHKREKSELHRASSILQRESPAIIDSWLARIAQVDELAFLALTKERRIGSVPALLEEVITRLQNAGDVALRSLSMAAFEHGRNRRAQGYSVPMIVEESRLFQVCIFHALLENLDALNFSPLITDLLAIADEIGLQLKSTMVGFISRAQRVHRKAA